MSGFSFVITFDEVMKITTLRRTCLYALIKKGEFPAGTPLLPNNSNARQCMRWDREEVESWIKNRFQENQAKRAPIKAARIARAEGRA